jgi:hypothetical protein
VKNGLLFLLLTPGLVQGSQIVNPPAPAATVTTGLSQNVSFTNTASYGVVGSTTSDSAAAGNIGEHVSSTAINVVAVNATYVNITSISLTPGDWDVTGQITYTPNTGVSLGQFYGAVSAFSGNTTTDHVLYDNVIFGVENAAFNETYTVAAWQVSLATTTTIYLKANAAFASGIVNIGGRISARRMR